MNGNALFSLHHNLLRNGPSQFHYRISRADALLCAGQIPRFWKGHAGQVAFTENEVGVAFKFTVDSKGALSFMAEDHVKGPIFRKGSMLPSDQGFLFDDRLTGLNVRVHLMRL